MTNWITDAIKRALKLYEKWAIEVIIVSYGASNGHVRKLVNQLSS